MKKKKKIPKSYRRNTSNDGEAVKNGIKYTERKKKSGTFDLTMFYQSFVIQHIFCFCFCLFYIFLYNAVYFIVPMQIAFFSPVTLVLFLSFHRFDSPFFSPSVFSPVYLFQCFRLLICVCKCMHVAKRCSKEKAWALSKIEYVRTYGSLSLFLSLSRSFVIRCVFWYDLYLGSDFLLKTWQMRVILTAHFVVLSFLLLLLFLLL